MLIYSHTITPRLEYIFRLIFTDILSVNIQFSTNLENFSGFVGPKINYSHKHIRGAIQVAPQGLLFERGIERKNTVASRCGNHVIFFQEMEGDLPFDLFSASFYLVTRYEEYLPFLPDKHGRFPARESFSFKSGVLKEPVVNQWALLLKILVIKKYPDYVFPVKQFTYLPTIDVDIAYCYLHKGWVRTAYVFFYDFITGNISGVRKRWRVIAGKEEDPFDSFGYMQAFFNMHRLHPLFFFLCGKRGEYDRNISPGNSSFRQLILKLYALYSIGIHPSYKSVTDFKQLKWETACLAKLLHCDLVKSRHHFLRLTFPQTYRNLITLGITEDYSMGYADENGFRAGIATPFKFYDLLEERETSLTVYPFQVMDVTLRKYKNYSQEQAIVEIREIISNIRSVNGMFVSLWHNNSLSDTGIWKGWKTVFEEMISMACNNGTFPSN